MIVPVTEANSSDPESNNSRESYVGGAYTLDLVTPPESASEVVKLPTLESKIFLRDLRSDKIKQICLLVTEDEYVADIRSAQVFAENEHALSSSSMGMGAVDEKTRIEQYTS
uniref:Uncharacterized protein n=1 Tax=Peronospora matthiolae TaxID=2874970 RepID=A0AAV1USF1_9STRA